MLLGSIKVLNAKEILMRKSEFRDKVDELLAINVDNVEWDEKLSFLSNA